MSALRLAAVTLIVVAVAGSTGAGAAPRTDAPLLTFSSLGLCATDLQGHMFRLTGPRQGSGNLSWSPDGSRLVFRSGQASISFIDAEGHSKGTLSWPSGDGEHFSSSAEGLVWSPDSRALAGVTLTGYHYDGYRSDLWVVDDRIRTLYSGGMISQPSWSPDGRQLVFSDWSTRKAYVIDSDGDNLQEVLDSADQPVWSPDGQSLAYVVLDENRERLGLAVARADGSGQERLTDGSALWPTWSPDGSMIAFTRDLGTSTQIDVIKADGTNERTIAAGDVGSPAWSPDGDVLAYAQGEPAGIVLVRPDGTNERIVETGVPGAAVGFPAWRRPAPLPTHRRACVISGTPGADVLRGKNKGDVLYGGAGGDRIYGAGGNDLLIGGPGHDWLFGGQGKDVFEARDGTRDYLFGGPDASDRGTWDTDRDKVKSVEHQDSR